MADQRSRPHLVCYDITDPRRLGRVHRLLKQRGVPVQYSVFLVLASPHHIRALMAELRRLLDVHTDDVRCYALPFRLEIVTLGPQMLPAGAVMPGEAVSPLWGGGLLGY